MKLKSLLMGSAAAMMTMTVANAADAPAEAEPEPVSYVRVCDMYGAGYFFIPGTSSCLKFEGYARSTYTYINHDDIDDEKSWGYRTRINMRVKEETDLGLLESYVRLQSDGGGDADGNIEADRALISLGGFRVGYTDVYWSTNHGYGTPGPINDAPSGFDQALIVDYEVSVADLGLTVGLQDETGTGDELDLYFGMAYSGDKFDVAATVGYTGESEELAYRLSASVDVIEGLTLKALFAAKAEDDAMSNFLTSNWEYGVGANYQATDEFNIYAAYYDEDAEDANGIVIGGKYLITSNFSVQAESTIYENDSSEYNLRVVRSF
ncbi:MAG: porin [Rhizobiaceae bacterium]